MKNKFSNKKYNSKFKSFISDVGFSVRDDIEILKGNKAEEEVKIRDTDRHKLVAQINLQISMLEDLLKLLGTGTYIDEMKSKFVISAPYLPFMVESIFYPALFRNQELLAREIIHLYIMDHNLKHKLQDLPLSHTTDLITINISDELVKFLDELGFNNVDKVLRVDLARTIMGYLEVINKHSDKIQEWELTERDLENLKSSKFYKYIGNEENLMNTYTVVDVYIQELKYKILELEEKVDKKYGYKRKERSKYNGVKRDKSSLESLYKLEEEIAGDDISNKFNISSQLRDFLISLGIELPSTSITKELGYDIKRFLEYEERALLDLYGKLWELNHPEGVKPDATHVESLDIKKLRNEIDKLNSSIAELNKSLEISIK